MGGSWILICCASVEGWLHTMGVATPVLWRGDLSPLGCEADPSVFWDELRYIWGSPAGINPLATDGPLTTTVLVSFDR
ncbi:protein of unknown function [Pseudomonas mediterranea]